MPLESAEIIPTQIATAPRIASEAALKKADMVLTSLRDGLSELRGRQGSTLYKLQRLESSWFKSMRKSKIAKLKINVAGFPDKIESAECLVARGTAAKEAAELERDRYCLDTDFTLSGVTNAAWMNVVEKFEALSRCSAIWDITAARNQWRGQERSIATEILERRTTSLRVVDLPILQTRYRGLCWINANGDDLYFYPGLIVVFRENDQFALLDMTQVKFNITVVKFQETDRIPLDAMRCVTIWTYANTNGTPDRRYRYNPEIPLVAYGQIERVPNRRNRKGIPESAES